MRRLNLLFIIFVTALGSGLLAQSQDNCSEKALPPQARLLIHKKFPGWRIKLPTDLDDVDKRDWDQYHPKECPGLAIGHFEAPDITGYGLLLIPITAPEGGSKIVVLGKTANTDGYSVKVLAYDEQQGASSGLVISKARPGKYTGFDTTQSVRLKLDGIEAEWIEKSSVLYFWRNGKYRTLPTSD